MKRYERLKDSTRDLLGGGGSLLLMGTLGNYVNDLTSSPHEFYSPLVPISLH